MPQETPRGSGEHPVATAPPEDAPASVPTLSERRSRVNWWEPTYVFFITFIVYALVTPRFLVYLNPTTGDEPFYLMTATSILKDRDINECNNYRQRDEDALYPQEVVLKRLLPNGWLGWGAAPYPLPPHPAQILPESRRCLGTNVKPLLRGIPSVATPLPKDGTENELYSKHGLGLALLVTLPFGLGDRAMVVFFLNALGALLAANVYLFAREATGKIWIGALTWIAFAFTVPFMPYSFLIFPELPAALLVVYAFRRIRLGGNGIWRLILIGLCIAFLPWLHYRFVPVSAGLFAYLVYGLFRDEKLPRLGSYLDKSRLLQPDVPPNMANLPVVRAIVAVIAAIAQTVRRVLRVVLALLAWLGHCVDVLTPVLVPNIVSAIFLMAYFYFLYGHVWPSAEDHAGISDLNGTLRGMAGSFLDAQWGLFVAAPIYILAIVGLILMATHRRWHTDLLWVGIVAVPYFLLVANYAQWWGEWCPPARYLTSVLPLMALPFGVALLKIRSPFYKAIYGLLMLLSLVVMGAFVSQPQWMYNQPTGTSQLLSEGLAQAIVQLPPETIVRLPGELVPTVDEKTDHLVVQTFGVFPSFVVPYFGYVTQGKDSGDYWAQQAWQHSAWPFVVIACIVIVSLLLALWEIRKERRARLRAARPAEGLEAVPRAQMPT